LADSRKSFLESAIFLCDIFPCLFVIIVERAFSEKRGTSWRNTMEKNRYILAVETYGNTVYRAAYQYCGNKSDAEDVVQNTFIKLLQSKKEFESEEYLKRWLIRVAINEAKNISMSFWKKRISSLEEVCIEKSYEFHTDAQSDLYVTVMQLPAKYRIVVHLYYFEDYSTKEISEILKLKETTVQTQLMRARGKLKEMLKEAWKDE